VTERPAIALEGLERRYGDRPALRGVSVTVGEGQTLAVFGANGAGKTTLLRVLATLLRPHAGSVSVLGAALPAEAWKVRGRVGFLGHEPLLYPDLTARENLLFHARLHGVAHARVGELLAQVGLESRAGDPVRELSRGMVQRLAAARAVLHDPAVLLLDEPRAGLDPAAAEELEPLIGRASGRTRVLVTHDVERGLREADVVLGLRAGAPELAGGKAAADQVRRLYS
jgi:heme exporter protein A